LIAVPGSTYPALAALSSETKLSVEIIRVKRNHAAHPALDGSERELDKTDYEDFLKKLSCSWKHYLRL
jgi:hypothetical protein